MGIMQMAKAAIVTDRKRRKKETIPAKVVTVQLSVSKTVARKLGRVARWERESEGTVLELTGRG